MLRAAPPTGVESPNSVRFGAAWCTLSSLCLNKLVRMVLRRENPQKGSSLNNIHNDGIASIKDPLANKVRTEAERSSYSKLSLYVTVLIGRRLYTFMYNQRHVASQLLTMDIHFSVPIYLERLWCGCLSTDRKLV
ncbi:hypothetical protein RRG08_012377 [Elysia crispata]|uniref:Uncharacterized protein n=1 Tax=Elysia crispata TaxID=231223 RepID=A0AAE0YH51_9GAST|nr:hypothetical protein RRG08_012377 [Elysia crispata]